MKAAFLLLLASLAIASAERVEHAGCYAEWSDTELTVVKSYDFATEKPFIFLTNNLEIHALTVPCFTSCYGASSCSSAG